MHTQVAIQLEHIYAPSEDVVAREIEGEFIIIPIATGVGDMEDELYSLNESGKAIWDKLDGKKTLDAVKAELIDEYEVDEKEIEIDIKSFVQELAVRNIIVAV